MLKKINNTNGAVILILVLVFASQVLYSQKKEVLLRVDGSVKLQQIDGFGANINTAWWYNGVYGDTKVIQPAIDILFDSLGATIFRAVIEEMDWEKVNDNNNPDKFNWDYYNKVFSNPRFQGVWSTLRYLNDKGITDGLIISLMGGPPSSSPLALKDKKKSWMGDTDYTISPAMEDEFVETIAALLYYARHTASIKFSLVSPFNESDVISSSRNKERPEGIVEGPDIPDALQVVRIFKKLVAKLDEIGMDDISFVGPDTGGEQLFASCFTEIIKDPILMKKFAHWGIHNYGNNTGNYYKIVSQTENPNKSFWVTEMAGIGNLFGQLGDGAQAFIFWDGFDCVYQHAIRNGYGSNPPNDWVFWYGPEEGLPLIEYIQSTATWKPRKQFYQFAQVFRFVKPGATQIGSEDNDSSLIFRSFINPDGQIVIVGRNSGYESVTINGSLTNLPAICSLNMIYTSKETNLKKSADIPVNNNEMKISVPGNCIFTITGYSDKTLTGTHGMNPEPSGWYAGDMHVHRNCGVGLPVLPESEYINMMKPNNLAVITVLADMGNGEVQYSSTDLPKVNGADAPQSEPGRIVHYDAEWHFDPEGVTFENKALGGHLVLLGLNNAYQIWDESTYKILEWGRAQNAVQGFCHMQYLNDSIQEDLTCCIPVDYPVEAALGTIDFLAEDVWVNDAAVKGYYRLLNCGFRLGWAAGTDYPCNNNKPLGSLLTYVEVKNKPLTYGDWIEGIKNGRTVVSTNGHNEFLDLKVNGENSPGDEVKLKDKETVNINVTWITTEELTGAIEIVCNGKVVSVLNCTAKPGVPANFKTNIPVTMSSWICARRTDEKGHRSHTAPVYISINNSPVRANADDARFFVKWIDNILEKIAPGGSWNSYFTHDLDIVQARYMKARLVYSEIALDAERQLNNKSGR